MKFKVGDKVIVKSFSKRPVHWNPDGKMDEWIGKIVTIRSGYEVSYSIEEDKTENEGIGWRWKESDFLPIPKPGDKVKLRTCEDMEKQYGLNKDGDIKSEYHVVQDMKEYCGKIVTVHIVSEESFNIEESSKWNWGFEALEKVYSKEEKMEFTKDMLKSGEHVVEYRNGTKRLYLNEYFTGPISGSKVKDYSIDLKSKQSEAFDIIAIYKAEGKLTFADILDKSNELIWKRDNEPIEISATEAFAQLREIYGKEVKIVEDKDD